jgi:hypothetical protein
MACKSIIPKGWSDAHTVENQCHLMDAICAETVALQIKKLSKRLDLSEEAGWSLYGLETVKQVLEQGVHWDYLFEILLVMDREHLKNVTDHVKNFKENHQATLDFLKNLRQTPEFSEYRFVFCYLSCWD